MAEYGVEELYSPSNPEFDIVYIHGLTGHRRATWTKDSILWPQTLLPTDVPNARVLTFGYDAAVVDLDKEVTMSTIETHARDIVTKLVDLRLGTPSWETPMVFVTHSLGGLVCAKAIVNGASATPTDNAHIIASHTRGIIFLGTPFHGSPSAKYMDVLARIVKLFRSANAQKVHDLREKSEKLEALVEAFASRLRQRIAEGDEIGVHFFWEALPTYGVLVVPESNAKIVGFGDQTSIYANHHDICKFSSREDEGYKSVLGAIKKFSRVEAGGVRRKDAMTNIWNNYGNAKVGQQVAQQNVYGGLYFS